MRRTTSIASRSLNANGASRAALSMVSDTSAILRDGRVAEPAKIKSSISPPRSRRADASPITQRSASTRFDLPQPFGPTIPVSPGSIGSSVASTKDLNPARRRRSTCMDALRPGGAAERRAERLDGRVALELDAVDEEGRRRVDAKLLGGGEAALQHLVLTRLVGKAIVELGLAHAAEQRQPRQRRLVVLGEPPLLLVGEQRVDKGVELGGRGAARDHRRAQGRLVERIVAQHELRLAVVDPRLLDLRQHLGGEMRAMRTGERGVLYDGDRRILVAQNPVVRGQRQNLAGIGGRRCRRRGLRPGRRGAGERQERHRRKPYFTHRAGPSYQMLILVGSSRLRNHRRNYFGAAITRRPSRASASRSSGLETAESWRSRAVALAGATCSFRMPPRPSASGQLAAARSGPAIAVHSDLSRARTPPPCRATAGPTSREMLVPAARKPGRRSPAASSPGRFASPMPLPRPEPTTLLAWYDRHRRDLPWRAPPGVKPGPYRVWLSEIMLQQTTVVTVAPYFDRFVARWPDVSSLAAASLDEVLHQWQGLGYYARARNLHACARTVVERHGGRFPDAAVGLRALPGIGDYTAAAIAAIAFDRREAAVDGNVERVVARVFAVRDAVPKPRLRALAAAL